MTEKLVASLVEQGALASSPLIVAFREISREHFVPADLRDLAAADVPLPIGDGQTVSQPSTVAFMLELLGPQAGERVLDVGSGSGWTSALLAHVVGERGKVVALERIPELAEMTRDNLEKLGFIGTGVVAVKSMSGEEGYPEFAPYDRILVSASGKSVPAALKKQMF